MAAARVLVATRSVFEQLQMDVKVVVVRHEGCNGLLFGDGLTGWCLGRVVLLTKQRRSEQRIHRSPR